VAAEQQTAAKRVHDAAGIRHPVHGRAELRVEGSVQSSRQDLAYQALGLRDLRATVGGGLALAFVSAIQRRLDVLHGVPADQRGRHQPGEESDLVFERGLAEHRIRLHRGAGPADERSVLVVVATRPNDDCRYESGRNRFSPPVFARSEPNRKPHRCQG
jgi:hypothetical protein